MSHRKPASTIVETVGRPRAGRMRLAIGSTLLFSLVFALLCSGMPMAQEAMGVSGDVARGWGVFTEKHCVRCHAIWDLGGEIGPDLGRSGGADLTVSDLAATLWNHIPKMRSYMERNRVSYPTLSVEEVNDLFGFLLFVSHLEQKGDQFEGEQLFREKGCARCHHADGRSDGSRDLDLSSWATYSNPIVWAQRMWKHAPAMARAMEESGIEWPQLDDTDLADIIAFARSLGSRRSRVYLRPGSVEEGRRLFATRGCLACHVRGGAGGDLGAVDLPRTLTGLATRMWNHSPEMMARIDGQDRKRKDLTPQEIADVIAYIFSLRESARSGDPDRGREVFVERRCSQCHREDETADAIAPDVQKLATASAPARFAQLIWSHGAPMRDALSEAGRSWPLLRSDQVIDLLAYFKSLRGEAILQTSATHRAPRAAGVEAAPRAVSSATSARVAGVEAAFRAADVEPREQSAVVAFAAPPPIRPDESCVSNTCHPNVLAGRQIHTPTAQGECLTCHVIGDAERHELTLVDETSRLCYRCHDSSAETTRIHTEVSASVCTVCHDPHSSEMPYGPNFTGVEPCFVDQLDTASPFELLARRGPPDVAAAPRQGPAAVFRSLLLTTPSTSVPLEPFVTPHMGEEVHALELPPPSRPEALAGGCTSGSCHVETVSNLVLHVPVAQQQCEACHRVVDENEHRFEITVKEPTLCYQCHDDEHEGGEFIHGPLGLGLCTPCHLPHGGAHARLLPEAGSDLCFTCHSEMGSHVRQSTVQHAAISENEKACLACHAPHRSGFRFQLRSPTPELCFECHAETREAINAASITHSSVLSSERSCDNCHDVHGSSVEKILVDTESNLCLGCHDRPVDTQHGTLVDMKSWIAANPERHGPIREGLCTPCHVAHGSQNFRILRHSFPQEFYRPFTVETYALCWECHEREIVLDRTTDSLTAFRNGKTNLHYVHVNREKGRTCRACHEVHAGTQPKRMKDYVPFGQWKYPVGFEVTADGGRCASGCHRVRAYSRDREIVQK